MRIRTHILGSMAAAMIFSATACNAMTFGQVEQGRTIAFDKDKREVVMITDTSLDATKPAYDKLPPVIFKLPNDEGETGPLPKAGQRMKLDTDKKVIVIYDTNSKKLETLPINITDLQQPIEKDHPLVFDKAANKAKPMPVIDKEKKTVTIYSGRQKMLCTFAIPENYANYPVSTWDAGDEVRVYYKTAGESLRFMNVSKTDIYKK
jgi:Domain of unknown function (DUF4881)